MNVSGAKTCDVHCAFSPPPHGGWAILLGPEDDAPFILKQSGEERRLVSGWQLLSIGSPPLT